MSVPRTSQFSAKDQSAGRSCSARVCEARMRSRSKSLVLSAAEEEVVLVSGICLLLLRRCVSFEKEGEDDDVNNQSMAVLQ